MFNLLHGGVILVRDHIPLEQGLRRICLLSSGMPPCTVRDHIPLEQGLRLGSMNLVLASLISQRPYSIRTRIKTMKAAVDAVGPSTGQRPYSIRTRIKTRQY